jgi:hypothetical protein
MLCTALCGTGKKLIKILGAKYERTIVTRANLNIVHALSPKNKTRLKGGFNKTISGNFLDSDTGAPAGALVGTEHVLVLDEGCPADFRNEE